MNELFAGYANYASTQAVLTESVTVANSPEEGQSTITVTVTFTATISITVTWTI